MYTNVSSKTKRGSSDAGILVGLYNLLVHCYWTVEDEKVYEALKDNFKCVGGLIEKVREVFLVEC